MRKEGKFLLLLLLFAVFICLSAFAEYARLDGKSVQLNGPFGRRIIGVAVDQATCDELALMLRRGGRRNFEAMLDSPDVLRVANHSAALVQDVQLFEGRAKITLLCGLYRGMTGWVPLEWLQGNQERPRLATPASCKYFDPTRFGL